MASLTQFVALDRQGRKVKLHRSFLGRNGRLTDEEGRLSSIKVRRVYMLAGLLPPPTDEDLEASVKSHVVLLNAFLESLELETSKSSRAPSDIGTNNPGSNRKR